MRLMAVTGVRHIVHNSVIVVVKDGPTVRTPFQRCNGDLPTRLLKFWSRRTGDSSAASYGISVAVGADLRGNWLVPKDENFALQCGHANDLQFGKQRMKKNGIGMFGCKLTEDSVGSK